MIIVLFLLLFFVSGRNILHGKLSEMFGLKNSQKDDDVCCSTCSVCNAADCCGRDSGEEKCYFCETGQCCGTIPNIVCCKNGYKCNQQSGSCEKEQSSGGNPAGAIVGFLILCGCCCCLPMLCICVLALVVYLCVRAVQKSQAEQREDYVRRVMEMRAGNQVSMAQRAPSQQPQIMNMMPQQQHATLNAVPQQPPRMYMPSVPMVRPMVTNSTLVTRPANVQYIQKQHPTTTYIVRSPAPNATTSTQPAQVYV